MVDMVWYEGIITKLAESRKGEYDTALRKQNVNSGSSHLLLGSVGTVLLLFSKFSMSETTPINKHSHCTLIAVLIERLLCAWYYIKCLMSNFSLISSVTPRCRHH